MKKYILNFVLNKSLGFYNKLLNFKIEEDQKSIKKQFKNFGKDGFISFPNRIMGTQFISIGSNFRSLYNFRLEAYNILLNQSYNPEIVIGDNVTINTDVHIGCINKIVIGNNVLIASRVYISDHSHGEINAEALELPPDKRPLVSKGSVIIEDNVWIGEGVCVLPGVKIGKNAIIGANSVVTKNIPQNTVAVGIPAKVIKSL